MIVRVAVHVAVGTLVGTPVSVGSGVIEGRGVSVGAIVGIEVGGTAVGVIVALGVIVRVAVRVALADGVTVIVGPGVFVRVGVGVGVALGANTSEVIEQQQHPSNTNSRPGTSTFRPRHGTPTRQARARAASPIRLSAAIRCLPHNPRLHRRLQPLQQIQHPPLILHRQTPP